MPTENRSSNADPRDVFIRLNPLGLGEQEPREDSTGFEDQRTHSDYLLFLAGYRESHPEQQHQVEPVAVLYADGAVLTKTDCGDAFATCCRVETPLYLHAGAGQLERLSKATAFVQRLVDCAGTQPSVATGYLRDILDELKGNTTPTAPVERNENAACERQARSRLTPLNLRLDEIGLYYDLVTGTAHDAWQARAALESKAS